MSKAEIVKRLVAGLLMVAITCGALIICRNFIAQPVSVDPPESTTKVVSTTKATTTEKMTEEEETTAAQQTEGKPAENTTAKNGEAVVTTAKKAAKPETTTKPQVMKYTGGALPYFEWEKAKKLSPNYFGESVFIGDSISLRLQMYGGLPGAKYLCYGSFGTCNALSGVIKANIWNCIPSGTKRVYVMLGMNDLNRVGVNGAASNMAQLCSLIQQNNPGVLIYIQSMTPIIAAKDGTNGRILNNANIRLYNQLLSGVAASHGWYFVDVASVMYDDRGYLKDEYCSDPGSMGMHFTNAGCSVWCWYLMNHCYDPSWAVRTLTVEYKMADGSKAPAASVVKDLKAGQAYSVDSPEVRGYTPDKKTVKGNIGTEDETITVTYTKDPTYTLTINYVKADGSAAAKTYTQKDFLKGDTYSVQSPQVKGFTANKPVVEGTFASKDVTVTVKYTADPTTTTTTKKQTTTSTTKKQTTTSTTKKQTTTTTTTTEPVANP